MILGLSPFLSRNEVTTSTETSIDRVLANGRKIFSKVELPFLVSTIRDTCTLLYHKVIPVSYVCAARGVAQTAYQGSAIRALRHMEKLFSGRVEGLSKDKEEKRIWLNRRQKLRYYMSWVNEQSEQMLFELGDEVLQVRFLKALI